MVTVDLTRSERVWTALGEVWDVDGEGDEEK